MLNSESVKVQSQPIHFDRQSLMYAVKRKIVNTPSTEIFSQPLPALCGQLEEYGTPYSVSVQEKVTKITCGLYSMPFAHLFNICEEDNNMVRNGYKVELLNENEGQHENMDAT